MRCDRLQEPTHNKGVSLTGEDLDLRYFEGLNVGSISLDDLEGVLVDREEEVGITCRQLSVGNLMSARGTPTGHRYQTHTIAWQKDWSVISMLQLRRTEDPFSLPQPQDPRGDHLNSELCR